MFGSDWPVCLLGGTYEQVLGALSHALAGGRGSDLPPPSADDEARLFGGTAIEFYHLS
jgi:L-fuconolactonase